MSGPMENSLIIFLRFPEPGRVKSRLAKEIGPERAAGIYRRMAERVLESTLSPGRYASYPFYTPADARDRVLRWLSPYSELSFHPQRGRDLGERIHNAFKRCFELGYKRVLIIGTDCISITRDMVERAFETLEKEELVIGPATDGGYYLIGLNRPQPSLFEDIDWGTERVLEQTLSRAREGGIKWVELEKLSDIDTYDDLIMLCPEFLEHDT